MKYIRRQIIFFNNFPHISFFFLNYENQSFIFNNFIIFFKYFCMYIPFEYDNIISLDTLSHITENRIIDNNNIKYYIIII